MALFAKTYVNKSFNCLINGDHPPVRIIHVFGVGGCECPQPRV